MRALEIKLAAERNILAQQLAAVGGSQIRTGPEMPGLAQVGATIDARLGHQGQQPAVLDDCGGII